MRGLHLDTYTHLYPVSKSLFQWIIWSCVFDNVFPTFQDCLYISKVLGIMAYLAGVEFGRCGMFLAFMFNMGLKDTFNN